MTAIEQLVFSKLQTMWWCCMSFNRLDFGRSDCAFCKRGEGLGGEPGTPDEAASCGPGDDNVEDGPGWNEGLEAAAQY